MAQPSALGGRDGGVTFRYSPESRFWAQPQGPLGGASEPVGTSPPPATCRLGLAGDLGAQDRRGGGRGVSAA